MPATGRASPAGTRARVRRRRTLWPRSPDGVEVLSRLAAEPGPAQAAGGAARPPALERVRDERTGEHYLEVRMPPPQVLDRVTGALGALLDSLRA